MQRVFDFLKENNAKNIAIFSHVRGDGDCLGAQTGLANVLSQAGYQVRMYNQDALSQNYAFLNGFEKISRFDEQSIEPDVCIAVDCASFERIGLDQAVLSKYPWVNIDHHISNTMFATLNIVDGKASSTCEILSGMLVDSKVALSEAIATSLYSGISTDTGSFLYPNASAKTFKLAASLLEAGADKSLVQMNVFENTSRKQIEIYKYLYANIRYELNDEVAYCVFTNEVMKAMNATSADFEGVVTLIKEIQGVELAILITELQPGHSKISMRTKEFFDANKCCQKFGGGGHVRASGASLAELPEKAIEQVLVEVRKQWEESGYAE